MTAARVVAVPFKGLKGHRSEEMTQTITILLHKELLFLKFYVKTVMPLALSLLFQNWYLLGVIMNSEPRSQSENLVPLRGVFENFATSTPVIFIRVGEYPSRDLTFFVLFCLIFSYRRVSLFETEFDLTEFIHGTCRCLLKVTF